METLVHVITIVGVATSATWVLTRALSKIETALSSHVAEDKAVQSNHEARIIRLEGRKGKSR